MTVRHLSESIKVKFQEEIEKVLVGEDITWDLLVLPGMQMGSNGQPIMGPPKGLFYMSLPNPVLGASPLVLSGQIEKDLFTLKDEEIASLVFEMVSSIRDARYRILNSDPIVTGSKEIFNK